MKGPDWSSVSPRRKTPLSLDGQVERCHGDYLSSLQHFFDTLSQPRCTMPPVEPPTTTTSSADHWTETLSSHFPVFSLGNFEGFAPRWNQASQLK